MPDDDSIKIAVQLYSLRSIADFDARLALTSACGFEWVEAVGVHGLAPAEFAGKLAAHGLRVASMHVGITELEGEPDAVLQGCQLTGCKLIVMPYLPLGQRPSTPSGWRSLGRRLRVIATMLGTHGIRLAYHNHDFEFLRYGSRAALDWVLGEPDDSVFGWEADLGWMVRAGADVDLWLDRYGERLAAVHAKDVAAEGDGRNEDGWAALGDGIIHWEPMLARIASLTKLVIFEHDLPSDPERTLRRSRETLRQYLG